MNPVVDSTEGHAPQHPLNADTPTSVSLVRSPATLLVPASPELRDRPVPRFLRGFSWDESGYSVGPTALSTVHDLPLPQPPPSEFTPEAVSTLSLHSYLFKIVTPINIPAFGSLLQSHPNSPFVSSVLHGLAKVSGLGPRWIPLFQSLTMRLFALSSLNRRKLLCGLSVRSR